MKLRVQNFRVFKEMAEFEIRPLTILVGPNNSGKSSFTKLLLLLKNGFKKLDFSRGDHHLGSYEKALNWDSDLKEMVLEYKTTYPLLPDIFVEEVRYDGDGEIDRFTITNWKTKQPFVKLKIEKKENNNGLGNSRIAQFYFDIDYIIDLIRNKELIVKCPYINIEKNFIDDDYQTSLKNLKKIVDLKKFEPSITEPIKYYIEGISLNSYKKSYDYTEFHLILNSLLINEANNLNHDNLLYEVYLNGKKIENKEKILNFQYEIFKNRINLYAPEDFEQPLELVLNSTSTALKNYLKRKVEEEYRHILGKDNKDEIIVEVKETQLGRLLFSEKLFEEDISKISFEFFQKTILEKISNQFFEKLDSLKTTEYIPANRGNQKRTFLSSVNDNTYQTSILYEKNKLESRKYSLVRDLFGRNADENLKSMLKVIGIEEEVTTKRLEDTLAVYVVKQGKEINLADYGFGYSQLIPIILKLYNLMLTGKPKYVIIEEPEANLHPALQAKLADIFSIAIKENKDWHLIIETHSEYFIRKLQYLTAKGDLKTKDGIIHYFNADENVSKMEPKVKSIEINEEGNLTDNFGPGFYDEATRLQFELLKLSHNQSN